jgi:hypothetical protein
MPQQASCLNDVIAFCACHAFEGPLPGSWATESDFNDRNQVSLFGNQVNLQTAYAQVSGEDFVAAIDQVTFNRLFGSKAAKSALIFGGIGGRTTQKAKSAWEE